MSAGNARRRLPLAIALLIAACGQRGPLTLPDSAQPIERLDPAAADQQPDADTPEERESQDDERAEQ